ncbi:PREDICTED: alkane hydroxylase MAH1-like [Ipomoea nil]|uniref:alkane hydroxylase MAH1-like n=1 Tax=Ipomoea nil TaxID=35883 RepID=UPI000901C815|nr:PREDICTED: alkane hydroxylase MAH1-like [Ipomoea nil]
MRIFKECYDDVIVVAMLCSTLCWVWKKRSRRSVLPTNWPVVGMLPALLQNAGRIHHYATELLRESGGTIEIKGLWFANMDMLVTCDPANVNHILCRNFENYPKGPGFRKIFHVLGDGMINVDSELWELHRKTTTPLMNQANFRTSLERNVSQKIENGLFPVLDHYAQQGTHIDLQEIFHRILFDISCQQFMDKDPGTLCVDPTGDHPFLKAIRDAVNAILYRHILPEWCWKLQKWVVGIDREKKLSEAWDTIDNFIYTILSENQEHDKTGFISYRPSDSIYGFSSSDESNFSMLASLLKAYKGKSKRFLRDTLVSLTIAGGGGTSSAAITWLFWLLAKNPRVEAKILDEINMNHAKQNRVFKVEQCQNLVYLHAALCESLRLFPPVPMNHKLSLEKDVLPSGHKVNPNTRIITSFYSIGRMEAIWGKDCMEFKPERWISDTGGIKHASSYNFPIFNLGPRTCLGKEMFFLVAKTVAASIILNYHCQPLEPHSPVQYSDTLVLELKHGFKVKLNKRT